MPPRPMVNKAITFSVAIDFDADGSFTTVQSTALGVTDDISRFVKDISITLGNSKPDDLVAAVGNCTIRLDNKSKYFSPANTASPLYGKLTPNKAVLVKVNDGVNEWTRFAGFTSDFTPTSGERLERECTVTCIDYLGKLQAHQLSMPIIANQTGDILAKLVVNAAINPLYYREVVRDSVAPVDGDSVTVNGTTYTFRNAVSAANDVLIDTTFRAREVSFDNLRKAMNGEGGSGTLYHAATTRPDYSIASNYPSHYQSCLDDSPVRYHRLGEAAGTTMYDYGTNASHGTYNGGFTLGVSGAMSLFDADKSVTFNGTTGYGSMPTLEFYGRSWSVEFWFNPSAAPTSNQDIFSVHSAFVANQAFYIRYNDAANGIITANFYSGVSVSSGAISAGTWYFIVVNTRLFHQRFGGG